LVSLRDASADEGDQEHADDEDDPDGRRDVWVALLDAALTMMSTGEADAPSGPPPLVSRYGSVKRLAPTMIDRMTTSAVAGRVAGIVTWRKAWTEVAPSTAADSYSSLGTFCRAAR